MLGFVGQIGYKGFETKFGVAEKCVQVVAVIEGKVGAKSNVACVKGRQNIAARLL
jgi:hypothetical protein